MADEVLAQLRGSAAEREAAYAHLLRLEAEHFNANGGAIISSAAAAEIAVACVSPLCEVLCKPVSEVDVAEYQRAAQVLTALNGVDPARVGGECSKPDQCNFFMAWAAPDSALGVVLAKEPSSLTAEDALIAACAIAPFTIHWAASWDAAIQAAGISTMDCMGIYMPAAFMINTATPSDDRNLVLVPLLLELLRAPEKLPDFTLPGVLWAMMCGSIGRPAVAAKLLEHDAIAVLMDILRQASPSELVAAAGYSRRAYGGALPAMRDLVESSQGGGVDLTAQLLSCGFIDVVVAALSAVEKVGEDNVNQGLVVYGLLGFLSVLDGEALPQIEEKLRAIPSALRCVKDSKMTLLADFGLTASIFATIVAANLWGKDEDNPFGFAQGDIDGFLTLDVEYMRCEVWGAIFPMSSSRCRGLLSLCISDVAKQMLLSNNGFIPHLLDGLMLDPEHPRKDFDETIKTAVQRDFAECVQQISLFPAGSTALKANSAVVDALDALVDKAWSEGAKDCARGALMQLTDRHHETVVGIDLDALHIMMSYQWDVQEIVKKIVAELQRRKYLVWFDLYNMKGSVMDAMSEAVESAELMLYGVSEKYKESANCRLELNYGMQEEVDMIPLMMQQGFKAKGWLGLILGQSLWYAFFESAVPTDEKFMQIMDSLIREIGDRGKIKTKVSEGVPPRASAPAPAPAFEPAPAPAPAFEPAPEPAPAFEPTPEPAPAFEPTPEPAPTRAPTPAAPVPTTPQRALAPVSAPDRGFSPSVQLSPTMPMGQHTNTASAGGGVSFSEMTLTLSSFIKEQRERDDTLRHEMEVKMERQRVETEARLDAKDVKMEQQRKEMEVKMEQQQAALTTPPPAAITDDQLAALQARIEGLHVTKLLTDEELFALEDLIADYVELTMSMNDHVITREMIYSLPTVAAASKLDKLVGLSATMAGDAAFARQARRKFM